MAGGRRRYELEGLAALQACSACPVATLGLEGAVPLGGPAAMAVDACCPHLSALRIVHDKDADSCEWELQLETDAEYLLGCVQLLTLCGPRLRELRLLGVYHTHAASYMALNRCTALVSLEVEAGWRPAKELHPNDEAAYEYHVEDRATEVHVLKAVAQLKTLRSLDLCINLPEELVSAPDLSPLRPNAECVAHLSALTALTRLRLVMSECYEHAADGYAERARGSSQAEVQEAHRTSLLSALRCMPQLQHLHCPTLWLTPGDAAPLTALTSLSLAGLLPPPVGPPPMQPAAGETPQSPTQQAAGAMALPPQLRELALLNRASPRALALLQPPPSFTDLDICEMSFGTTDVTAEGWLRPEAVDAVGPAVRLVSEYRGHRSKKLIVGADSGPGLLQPREDSPDGHMEWIRQLKGMDVCGNLELTGLALSTGDLSCLAQTLPGLTELHVWTCSFPVAALPVLRPPMLQLAKLELDFYSCGPVDRGTLEAVLVQLCRPPHGGAAPLKNLRCGNFDSSSALNISDVRQSVTRQLATFFGIRGVEIGMW